MGTAVALRELGLGSLKRIYRLDTFEVCSALQEAAKRRTASREVWDALLYRATLLRSDFRPFDLALTVDALARVRQKDPAVLDYFIQEVRAKARRFLVRDAALLLNALAKIGFRDELLLRALTPALLRRISEQSKWEDLSLLALSMARIQDQSQAPVFDRIVAALTPRLEGISDGHALSLLACAFSKPPRLWVESPGETDDGRKGFHREEFGRPLFPAQLPQDRPMTGTNDSVRAALHSSFELPHVAFIEVLLEQCERRIFSFRASDVLHLCLALAELARAGHEELIPPRLIPRMAKRFEFLYYELLPGQFVRLLDLCEHLPELEARIGSRLLDELAYRARDLTPKSCLPLLRAAQRLNHTGAQSAAAWRLTRSDAAASGPTVLSATEVCEAAALLSTAVGSQQKSGSSSFLWEAREALLTLLQGLQQRHLEPEPDVLARLLHSYGLLSVRDTHWFHLCKKLLVCDLSQATVVSKRGHMPSPVPAHESLDEDSLAAATLALARLSLPQLVDAASLFSRASRTITSPVLAASVLEAAAIFSLTERRPQDLTPAKLVPLVALVCDAQLGASEDEGPGNSDVLALRLFPFCGGLAETAAGSEVVAEWQRVALARSMSSEPRVGVFEESVAQELTSWGPELGLQPGYRVGPLRVDYALHLVRLAEHLRRNPLASQEIDMDDVEPTEDAVDSTAKFAVARRAIGLRAKRRAAHFDPVASQQETSSDSCTQISDDDVNNGEPSPLTHVLLKLLREHDFFHSSPLIRGDRQRSKGKLLAAEQHAEVRLLRLSGWHVCCIPEHLWQLGIEDGDLEAAAKANRELIFNLVANLDSKV
eukprot:TRINITY_DN88639_c0_g1_i1.p1 TRINITY_DN88639_c0_g1~~TRINITY_DN88639_c0_g1_i1.p1  ORF type:complete len:835 (-),score=144.88 TRINITY_DN88639_c0_g1_i1:202-2685(-)